MEVMTHTFDRIYLVLLAMLPVGLLVAENKYSSFQRQLNLYGFRKLVRGNEAGGYMHPLFERGKPEQLSQVRRGYFPEVRVQLELLRSDDQCRMSGDTLHFSGACVMRFYIISPCEAVPYSCTSQCCIGYPNAGLPLDSTSSSNPEERSGSNINLPHALSLQSV